MALYARILTTNSLLTYVFHVAYKSTEKEREDLCTRCFYGQSSPPLKRACRHRNVQSATTTRIPAARERCEAMEGKGAEGLRVYESKNEGIKRSGGRSQRRGTDGGLSAAGCDCVRVQKSNRGFCARAVFGESLPLLL